ncbi:SsgA family sporulation/cell division regulator [Streptomyces antarcticus]|uniref:SsgA family sporulation/cell division regulator n=1 Tax=Streptomyces antarcticus TaxID=2996458 RepID=UPI00226D9B31|nr:MULTISPECIES: SsgA family sporulation/cell division regulator [unclassified Streptomyces]MCY0943090.1 SsgA family sporulation/cell division regulator [Streptomyces sp. H34-AA3]MCZ4084451.1 SsgA family sporulation/cell division regulator [Streptomyces sp. H34-S5]
MSALIAARLNDADGDEVPLLGRFSYDSADPYAVRAQFFAGQTVLPYWYFDRQMLAEGLQRPVGEGDVTFRPQRTAGGEEIRVGLRDSAGGQGVVLLVNARAVRCFLEETYAVTAPGSETFDADGFLEDLLAR